MSARLREYVLIGFLFVFPLFSANAQEFLPPEQAFKIALTPADAACKVDCRVLVQIDVADGYYLYRERFKLNSVKGLKRLEFQDLPHGKKKFDENLGHEVEALRGQLLFSLVYVPDGAGPAEPLGNLVSQGCADAGLCYPPVTTPILFKQGNGGLVSSWLSKSTTQALPVNTLSNNSTEAGVIKDEASALASKLDSSSQLGALLVFFGLGLLLAFTPCTLPMLPIVTSLVLGDARTHPNRLRPIALAFVYVVGMALTYAVLGVIAGLTGQSLVVALQQPAVLLSFFAVLMCLGAALLLGYSLQVPLILQSWIHNKTGSLRGGAFIPVMVMGVLSALLLGPCVAPPLAGALLYIGQTGDAVFGGLALFILALGMGLPLVLVAGGAGSLLPRAGQWMKVVSAAFGFALLGLAIWVISPVVSATWLCLMWAVWAAFVFAALQYGMPVKQFDDRMLVVVVCRALALLFAMAAIVYALGFFSGAGSVLRPLGKLVSVAHSANEGEAPVSQVAFERVQSGEVDAVIAVSQRPVMLDFYADWCVSCKEFELFTLTDPQVQARLKGMRLLQVDVTENSSADQALLKQHKLFGPPAILFFKAGSTQVVSQVIGFQNGSRFAQTLSGLQGVLGL